MNRWNEDPHSLKLSSGELQHSDWQRGAASSWGNKRGYRGWGDWDRMDAGAAWLYFCRWHIAWTWWGAAEAVGPQAVSPTQGRQRTAGWEKMTEKEKEKGAPHLRCFSQTAATKFSKLTSESITERKPELIKHYHRNGDKQLHREGSQDRFTDGSLAQNSPASDQNVNI